MANTIPTLSEQGEKNLRALKAELKNNNDTRSNNRILTVEYALDFTMRFLGIDKYYENFDEIIKSEK